MSLLYLHFHYTPIATFDILNTANLWRKNYDWKTNKPKADIPSSPTFKHLGGTYVKSIVDQIKKIGTPHDKNEMMLTCKQCGHSGKYNIGMMAIDISDKGQNKSQQFTGYFRRKTL